MVVCVWAIELVFKELKQHLNLEILPSSDRHAVLVLAWASLLALALSRCVAAWIQPLALMTGLEARARPYLVTRALRSTVRMLGRVLVAPVRRTLIYLRDLADELLLEARTFETTREDSFRRLLPLLPRSPA